MYGNGIMREQMLEGIEKQPKEKLHGKCHERDCLAKKEILTPLVNGDMKLAELHKLSTYQGSYKQFTSNLSKYVKRGYVNALGQRRNYVYQLTELGMEKCIRSPFGYRQMRVALHEEKMKKYAENPKNKQIEFVRTEGVSSGHSVQYVDRTVGHDLGDETHNHRTSDDTTDKLNVDEPKDNEIAKLKNKNKTLFEEAKEALRQRDERIAELEQQLADKNNVPEGMNPKECERKMKTEQRIAYRKDLVAYYESNRMNFDYAFFNNWKMYPVRVKGKNMIKKGDIEIMSKTNSEFARGHVKGELPPNDVIKGCFHITKKTKAGICVIGAGMKEEKLMTW
ncbi:hypothetical protein [Methanococcoides sp. NM1]|uniref:hypothetical protein n=1 Tax=Methanococcoides sp. NM1 TaxID=1201013 RepID=UPI001083640B|nr:hypothetical protein [Methanococcoides sp. NM1]